MPASLKKVAVTGGPAVTLSPPLGRYRSRGATWGRTTRSSSPPPTGRPACSRSPRAAGPRRSSRGPICAGRSRSRVAGVAAGRPGRAVHHHGGHRRPRCRTSGRPGSADRGRAQRPASRGAAATAALRCASGHLVYATAGALRAVPFDLARLEMRGTPVPVVRDVSTTASGGRGRSGGGRRHAGLRAGGRARPGSARTLVWVDRQGRETPIPAPPRAYRPAAPVARWQARRAVHAADQELDIWLWDLDRPTLTRVTFGPAIDFFPDVDARRQRV